MQNEHFWRPGTNLPPTALSPHILSNSFVETNAKYLKASAYAIFFRKIGIGFIVQTFYGLHTLLCSTA